MKSYAKPTSRQVDAAVPLLSSPQHEAHFFSHLENPYWIAPLAQRGVFRYPPKAEHVKGGGIRFPVWPPSRFLVRMATRAAGEVASIFAKMETDNASVVRDIVEAALAMPVDVASSLVPVICRAATAQTLWISFNDATELCVRLGEAGKVHPAMELCDALFKPTFEEGEEDPSLRDRYWYKEGLRTVVPILARADPRVLLPKLCDWLKASIEAKRDINADAGSDLSYIWRPAIEEHEQNHDHDFAGAMVGFVREGFEQAIRSESTSLEESLQILEHFPYLVFKRIRLHLIGEFADQAPELARVVILNRELLDNHEHKHEYAVLLGRRFDLLSRQQQDAWFGWVDAGPDMSYFDEFVRDESGREATGQDRQNRIHYWQFEKLHLVRNHLNREKREFYSRMLAEHGEPSLADFNARSSVGHWGHESPMTVDDLAKMTFAKAVHTVSSSWKPAEPQFLGPSMEGLASTFRQYVATNPEEFSSEAELLVGRPAIFVRSFITAIREAVKEGRDIDLPVVLDLCQWVVGRPIGECTTPEQQQGDLVDPSWQWTRDEISNLVENVCKAKDADVPRYSLDGLRERIWHLIKCLGHDRAESYILRDLSEDDPRVHDYLDLGINSPRGKAVEASLDYALWVTNHLKQSEGDHQIPRSGFDAMREVREMLDWQITPGNRSFEAMSVIGARIGVIFWIDSKWLTENADRLFHLEGVEQIPPVAEGWAAWNAFLVWNRPHIEFYRALKSQFAYAVEQTKKVELSEHSREQPLYHLGEHLMILYARGQLGLDDDEGLLRSFLENSNPEVRRHAVGFVGRTLRGDENLSTEIVERLMALWDLYWSGPGKKDAREEPRAWLFGTWFSCGQFPNQWALDRLERFVALIPTPEPDHAIAEKLAAIAHVDITKAVRILDRVVRGDQEGWQIQTWVDAGKDIIAHAMKTPGEAAKIAVGLVDYLGRRGYTDLGQLLER